MNEFSKLTSIIEIVSLRDSFDYLDPKWHQAETRLRELLAQKYGDEQALCLKASFLPSYIKPGFVPAQSVMPTVKLVLGRHPSELVNDIARIAEFVPRAYCEYNPLYKQIIPYVVAVTPEKKVFTMERIEGDDRLIGKVSIGIGGHINVEDEGVNTIMAGIKRELAEEVQGVSSKAYLTFEGFLYDPSDNVGLDHVGFIFFLRLPDSGISIREHDKLKGYLSTKAELETKHDRMENWSRMVFDSLIK